MAPQTTDWAVEIAKGQMATTKNEYEEMNNQMSRMGLKGAYNPANVYPGSRFTPSSKPTPEEVREKARLSSEDIVGLEYIADHCSITCRYIGEALDEKVEKETEGNALGSLTQYVYYASS